LSTVASKTYTTTNSPTITAAQGVTISNTGASSTVATGTGAISAATLRISSASTLTSAAPITARGVVEIESTGGLVTLGNDVVANLAGAGDATRNIGILLKTTDRIRLQSGVDLTSGGSDIVLWADSDDNGVGPIFLAGTNLIFSNGGDIVMGGGLDNGGAGDLSGRTLGDGVPDGYAKAVSGATFSDNTNHAGIGFDNGYQLLSAGGNIELNGQGVVGGGVSYDHGVALKAGLIFSDTGTIAIVGKGPNTCNVSYHRGIFTGWQGNTHIVSNSTAIDAIYMRGDTSACNNTSFVNASAIMGWSENTFVATPNGGGINLSGSQGSASHVDNWYTSDILLLSGYQLISNTGPITINATKATTSTTKGVRFRDSDSQGISYLGSLASNHSTSYSAYPTIAAVSSTSNVTINSDSIHAESTSFRTNGHILLQPNAASFDSTQTFDSTLTTTWPGTYASVTIGKPGTNGSNQSSNALSVDRLASSGAIKVYGGDVTLNRGLTTTAASGDGILVKATRDIVAGSGTSAARNPISVTGTNSTTPVTLWSNADATGGGSISIGNYVDVGTRGGDIIFGGSAAASDTEPTSYADGINSGTCDGVRLGSSAVANGSVSISSNGGNITLRGRNTINAASCLGIKVFSGASINSGAGSIVLDGLAAAPSGSNNGHGIELNWSGGYNTSITSAKTSGSAISITGRSTGVSTNGRGIVAWSGSATQRTTISATAGGNISLVG
jgi:hypothetical protein